MDKPIYIGCISGTSVDGLDLAAMRMEDGIWRFVAATTYPLNDQLQQALLEAGQVETMNIDRHGELDARLGDFIGEQIVRFMTTHEIASNLVGAIGSHGQTIRHRPQNQSAFTMQIGDPNRIAEHTKITTVADFRRRDMAAGGEGAPLVPPFHEVLFGQCSERPVIVNIGGISNVTLLGQLQLQGFDTGPGNCLMDSWIQRHRGESFDTDGAWARTGTLDSDLLQKLLSDPYFGLSGPKSTGREYFNLPWLTPMLDDGSPADIQRTLLELTAQCIVDAVKALPEPATELIICGGGRLNGFLMERLASLSQLKVAPSETYGVDGDAIEAAAFAWLAAQTLASLPGNAPGVTGAQGPRVLGAIYPA